MAVVVALIVVDLLLGSVLWDENGAGVVVLAVAIAVLLGVFGQSRKRTRRHR